MHGKGCGACVVRGVCGGGACVVGGGMHGKGARMARGACVARGEGHVCRTDGH